MSMDTALLYLPALLIFLCFVCFAAQLIAGPCTDHDAVDSHGVLASACLALAPRNKDTLLGKSSLLVFAVCAAKVLLYDVGCRAGAAHRQSFASGYHSVCAGLAVSQGGCHGVDAVCARLELILPANPQA